ncbi:hypothetical protein KQI52_16700 [bacterium]|nr:hypothetical protein [bacterium]
MASHETAGTTYRYRVSRNGQIESVSDNWDSFALGNDGERCVSDAVLGTSLWLHLSGELVRDMYRQLVDKVLRTGDPIEIPLHCDSPDRVRHLTLTLQRLSEDEVEFTSKVEKVVERDTLSLLLGDLSRDPNSWVTMCSYCKEIQVSADEWQPAEQAVKTLQLFERDVIPHLTHGVCPHCYDDVMSELDDEIDQEKEDGET